MNSLLRSNKQILNMNYNLQRFSSATRKYAASHYGSGFVLNYHHYSNGNNSSSSSRSHRWKRNGTADVGGYPMGALIRSTQGPEIPSVSPFSSYYAFREYRLGRIRYEHVSSKVEATVKTMKTKQKEKVEEIMKEASSAGTAGAPPPSNDSKKGGKVDAKAAATTKSTEVAEVKKSLRTRVWEELVHYYHGFRLLFVDINICRKLLWRVLNGKTLSRRENRLLVRTTSDLFRLIPFSIFIIVPFMEILLPFFIKFFPGMLPSTFQTAKDREDKLKQSLQVKLEMAKFLQKTLDEMAVQHKEHKSEEAKQFTQFFEKIKNPNEYVSNEDIIKYAKRFEDEVTLDSLSREQLVALCRVLELNTMGTTNFLRFQLRLKLRSLRADDRDIAREGVNSLDLFELQQACKSRGMRAYGLTSEKLRSQLQEWIDLSLNEKVPPVLLLLSRALLISDDTTTTHKLKETIRVLPEAVAKQTKAAIGEREGKIDNKTKIEIIKEEVRKIKEEREEEKEELKAKAEAAAAVLLDKAEKIDKPRVATGPSVTMKTTPATAAKKEPVAAEAAEGDNKISVEDVELLSQAVKKLSSDKKTMAVEKETIKEIKEELEEYKEDVEELKEVRSVVKEPVQESRAAKLLFKKVNSMLSQLDKALEDLEKKNIERPENDPTKKDDSIHINELVSTIKRLKKTSDDVKMDQIENILSKIDMNKDGVITVDEVLKVTEALTRENVKLDEHQLEELVCLLYKEQLIEAEEKIEKALAKSQKEAQKNLAMKKKEFSEKMGVMKCKSIDDTLKDNAPEVTDKTTDMNEEDRKNDLKQLCDTNEDDRKNDLKQLCDMNEEDKKNDLKQLCETEKSAAEKACENQREKIMPKVDKPICPPPTIPTSATPPPPSPSSCQSNTKDKTL